MSVFSTTVQRAGVLTNACPEENARAESVSREGLPLGIVNMKGRTIEQHVVMAARRARPRPKTSLAMFCQNERRLDLVAWLHGHRIA
jgi:hypothetical protein